MPTTPGTKSLKSHSKIKTEKAFSPMLPQIVCLLGSKPGNAWSHKNLISWKAKDKQPENWFLELAGHHHSAAKKKCWNASVSGLPTTFLPRKFWEDYWLTNWRKIYYSNLIHANLWLCVVRIINGSKKNEVQIGLTF